MKNRTYFNRFGRLRFKLFAVWLMILISITNGKSQGLDSLDRYSAYCGTTPQFQHDLSIFIDAVRNGLSPLSTEFTYKTKQQFLAAGGTPVYCAGGRFAVYYDDFLYSPLDGFAEPTLGPDRRATLCTVLEYIESVIEIPSGIVVELFVARSHSPSNLAGIGTTWLGRAQPLYAIPTSDGIIDGNMYSHIVNGVDPDPTEWDGWLIMNFDEVYAPGNIPMNLCYYENYPIADGNSCCWDLYTVLLHEVTHTLGWISFLTENASGFAESIWAPLNSFSKYDSEFLHKGDVLTGVFEKLILPTPEINPILINTPNLLSGFSDIWLYDNGIPNNQPVLSGGFPGWPMTSPGSIISHLDDQRETFLYRSQYSPGIHPEYVMGPSLTTQNLNKQQWSLPELRVLFQLYAINPSFANSTSLSVNGTDLNSYILFNNTPPYRSNNSIQIFGDVPEFPEVIPADVPVLVNDNTLSNPSFTQYTFSIQTVGNIQDNESDPISVYPNSVFGIRGVSSNGNNHDALFLDPTNTTFTYTPPPGFVGRAQFGFYLFDGHEKGNLEIYTIEVIPGTAYVVPFGDNLVFNGNYEDATEVRTRFGASNVSKPYTGFESNHRYGYMQGAHFSGGHPFMNWNNSTGTIIKDSQRNCSHNTNPLTVGYFGRRTNSTNMSGTAYNYPYPIATGSTNEKYLNLTGDVNYSTLINPVQPCSTYRFECDINFPIPLYQLGQTFHFDLHFTDDPGSNPTGNTIYQTVGIDVPVTAVNDENDAFWQHVSVDFWYCGQATRYMNLESSLLFNFTNIVAVDNIQLKERIHQPLSVDAGPDHSISNTCNASGCVQLNVTSNNDAPDNTRCGFTYGWTPTTALSDPAIANPLACPTSTTTYTVEVTDPCTGEIATDKVTIHVLPPGQACLSIDKSVAPSQGNALTNFTFTIVACNTGNTPEQVTLTDNLPPGAINVASNLPVTSITIPTGVCNTYTVTCNIPDNGIACNKVQITDANNNVMEEDACVTIDNSLCLVPPGYANYSNYISPSGSTTINGNIYISGLFTVSPGTTVTIEGCDVFMTPNARIVVANDAILNITTTGTPTYMYGGCGYMWDGIYIMGGTGTQNDGILNINNGTRIEDALYAVYSDNDGGDFHIDNSFFELNYVSIHAFNRGHFGFSNITDNQFDASGPLKPTLAPAPTVTSTFAHIDAQNINEIITADNNTFNPGSEYGIYALKVGRLESFQNRFTKPGIAGIYGEYVKEMMVSDFNAFNQCPIGLECYQTDLRVDNQNSFTNGNFGIVAAKKSSCRVTNQNQFTENKIGIYTNYHTYTNIDNNVFDKEFVDVLCWATYGTIIISNNVMNDPDLAGIFSLNNIFNTTTVQHIHHNQISNTNPNSNNPNTNTAAGIVSLNNANTNRNYNVIEGNRIQDIGYGIQLTKSDYSKVTDNEITLPENDNTFIDYRGINAEVSNNCIIGKNLVHGRFVPEFITSGTGIHVTNSSRVWEICNEVNNLFNGLLWESNSFGAILFANSMVECAQDLYLKDVAAGLGQQFIQWGSDFIPFDNQWINSLNLQIVSDASNQFFPSETEFVVRNLSPYIPTNLSAINLPSNICLISTPANITPDPIDCSLVQYSIPKDESREALLIARDSLNFQPGEEGLKWMSQEYLFHLLKMQPQLLLDYPELNAALATLESGAISDFNKLTDTLVIATDSTVQSVLADTLNVLDLDSLALAKAAEVKALNDALTVQQQIEENKRVMNDVYLSTSAIGMTDYSPAQLNNIRNIAAQCPATGGPSVYEARALLMLVDSTRADYSSSCTGLLRNAASESKYPVNFIGRIYPNPSTGVVNYEYRMEKNSAGTITINNVWGQELKRIPLTECLNTLTIDCGNFADGIYLYNIVVNNTTIARGKLSIIKE